MISIDDHPPPDPSSSHHHRHQQQQISHDLNVSDIDLKSPDADLDDTNNQLPTFSIRDYVFGLRSKDVSCNWPFSPTSLQLCLKHGVKNLLPPFQSLDSLKDNSEIVSSLDGKKPRNDRFKSNASTSLTVTVSTNSGGSKRDNEHAAHTRSKEKPPASIHNTENIKKSKLVMKLNPGVEQVEEMAMSSKICPVCKTFSSSSNTTLNAHIDQCLTGDQGTMKWSDNTKVIAKVHRVKPRKTRSMVEIYKTAPHCTIEELDRRNGTSWATNSNFPAQEFQFDQGEADEEEEEEKQLEPRTTTTINRDVVDNEGDVYIDTDGTKVRILSVPKSGSLSDHIHGKRNLLKGVKGSKFGIGKKKNNLYKQKHQKKFFKVSPNARKLCLRNSKARSGQEDDERHRKPVADSVIVRPPWACSKRTNLVKKFTGKRKHRNNLVIESDKSSSSPPLSSDDVALSQSRKKVKSSSPLMEFTKESTVNDSETCPSSSPSEDSDSVDSRSKSRRNISSLRKNRSFKFNLKRKPVTGGFQDSSKENSENEEHEDTRSVTSKSTSNETADVEALNDVDSVRIETLPNLDQVCVVPVPNFTGLSNSFGPEFSKCVELYQEQLLCSTNRAPDFEKHDFFIHEDDPIPIPGPPGSFLPPSPGGDPVSDEQLQANSSSTTITTRVEIENHHMETMDRDSMSNSPVSTVSNPSLARSDSRSTSVVQDEIRPVTISGLMVDGIHTKSFPTFKNDQPCCCSRKEVAATYQELAIIKKKQSIELSNKNSSGFNFRSDTFPLSMMTPAVPETGIFPITKKLAVDDSVVSPKPVLRLMGKNLTVVKPDEDASPVSQQHSQSTVLFSHNYQNGSESQRFNAYPPVHVRGHGGFMAPTDRYGYNGGPYHNGHNTKEIIVIDDNSPENETDDSMRNAIMRRNRGQMNPVYTNSMYQSQSSGHLYSGGGGGVGGSAVFRGGGFQTSLGNGDLGKWNVGSSSPSRATSHMRSSTPYYPPSYQ